MKMSKTGRLGLAAVVSLVLSATPSRADIVSVHGTAAGFEIEPTGYLAKIGFAVDLQGSFEFWYSYSTTQEYSPGSFKLVSKNAGGTEIDVIDLNPTTVIWRAKDDTGSVDPQTGPSDEYSAGAQSTRAGTLYQVMVDLVDRQRNTLPDSPATYLNNLWPENYLGVGVADPDCQPLGGLCEGFVATVTSLSATVTPEIVDTDGDGIPDAQDRCADSSSGAVNADGCTIEQLVPCAGPQAGGTWPNHGRYVSELARTAQHFLDAGLITEEQKDDIVAAAASSNCGH
jgi:hypothetical protein